MSTTVTRYLTALVMLGTLTIMYMFVAIGTLPTFSIDSSMTFGFANLAANLGITTAAATRAIQIIDTASNIALIVSLLAVIFGAGVITTGLVITAKYVIRRFGKKYAIAW
ncbi:MAG: uberolysin/carnocyclin family circular bacteriocin [Chloroflexota bacterium]